MEPQFIINLGYLEKYNLKSKDFLDLLGIDLKNSVSANKNGNCPKCERTNQDVYFVYHKYKDFKFGVDYEGKDADYSYTDISVYLCICGCLYYACYKPSRISCDEECIDEKKEDQENEK